MDCVPKGAQFFCGHMYENLYKGGRGFLWMFIISFKIVQK